MDFDRLGKIVTRAPDCRNEEATKQSLVLPFLQMLGYDVFNPSEVSPEHHSDFSDRNRNRVDYAIMLDEKPVIGFEVKTVGTSLERNRGQLRGYFNASPSIKVGVLTDGIVYECFADTDEPNIMDEAPFLRFDISELREGDRGSVDAVSTLSKGRFDPERVGASARRKLMFNDFVRAIRRLSEEPTDDFTKCLLSEAKYQGRQTRKLLDECTPIARDAFRAVIERELLKRIGYSEEAAGDIEGDEPEEAPDDGIITTEDELAAYNYAVKRLRFLVDTDEMWAAVDGVKFRDYKSTFKVFYRKTNAGSLFNYSLRSNGEMVFEFPALGEELATRNLAEIDAPLLESFKKRVT